jgi:signal transduction histidine kinase
MKSQHSSIRSQLLKAIMLTTGGVLFLASTILIGYELVSLRRAAAEHLTSLAHALAENCAGPLAFDNPSEAQQVLASLGGEPHLMAAALYDRQNKLFAVFHKTTTTIPAPPGDHGYRFSNGRLEVFQPVARAGSQLGTLYLCSDLGAVNHRMRIYALIALGVIATSLLAGLLLSNQFQRSISAPILNLARVAKTITERNDYSVRAQKLSSGELGLLTEAFNKMLDEIQQREAELRHLKEDLEIRVEHRTAELAAANRELEAFGYSVSHDLRAPLRHIDSYVRLLKRDAGRDLNPATREDLQIITDSTARMGDLIDGLLSLSRLGRATMIEQTVSLPQLVEDARRELAPVMAGRAIEWHIGVMPSVRADPNLLRNVFVNFLSNALKYTRPRNPARIEIASKEEGEELICHVKDNGVGFEMEFVDKLFGVFQRLHAAEDFEGTGIGLASARRIIQRHGGRTWAEGQVDQGATFYFSLPKWRLS